MDHYHSTTTLKRIRAARPCRPGWTKLLAHLGKTAADDEPLALLTVLDSNGLDDALWVLDADPALDRLRRHYQAAVAERVLPIFEAECPGDMRVRDRIAMLRRDDATPQERVAACAASLAAAWDAACGANWNEARDAAEDAANAAALEDASSATKFAAQAAVGSASSDAWDTECAAHERLLRQMLGAAQ